MKSFTLHLDNRLLSFRSPQIMAILNLTPDSFYSGSRLQSVQALLSAAEVALCDGATILDLGGYSTRPNAEDITEAEEWQRLDGALKALREQYGSDLLLSVDTFRSEIARRAVTEYGVQIINDISGGELDEKMFQTVAHTRAAYILMHMRGTPQTMQQLTQYDDLLPDIIDYFQRKIDQLQQMGAGDLLLDPGFGFAKTVEQNYELLVKLQYLHIFERPLLIGLSRKSMLYKLLQITPEEALNATTAAHIIALQKGASILRVHDVRAAREAIQIYEMTSNYGI